MKKNSLFLAFTCMIMLSCTGTEEFRIVREVAGPYKANCYLIYGTESREAALIDPGWKIDTLVKYIHENDLHLKYIFITHGHTDHYYYVPELKRMFPGVKWGINKADYENIIMYQGWAKKAYGEEWVERTRQNPEESIYLDFDTRSVGLPDILIENNQTYKIGSIKIRTLFTPGHTPGGMCYYTDKTLFSGDLLFYRSVGNLDNLTSNREVFIKTVRELYRSFPDSTIVYPGHNQVTDIGSEKRENKRISLTGGEYDRK